MDSFRLNITLEKYNCGLLVLLLVVKELFVDELQALCQVVGVAEVLDLPVSDLNQIFVRNHIQFLLRDVLVSLLDGLLEK